MSIYTLNKSDGKTLATVAKTLRNFDTLVIGPGIWPECLVESQYPNGVIFKAMFPAVLPGLVPSSKDITTLQPTEAKDSYGIRFSGEYDLTFDGIDLNCVNVPGCAGYGGWPNGGTNIVIKNGIVRNTHGGQWTSAIDGRLNNCRVTNMLLQNIGPAATNQAHGIYLSGTLPSVNNVFEDIEITNVRGGYAITVFSYGGNINHNNIFSRINAHHNPTRSIHLGMGTGNALIDSLVWNNGKGIIGLGESTKIAGCTIYKNGEQAITQESGSGHVYKDCILWGNYKDVNLLKAGSRTTPNNLVGIDPRFVDAANGDFRLLDGSPAIGTGSGGRDIGAVQRGGTPPPPPPPPVRVRLNAEYSITTTDGKIWVQFVDGKPVDGWTEED